MPHPKAKRRKLKPPPDLHIVEDDHTLQMRFRTNWRLSQNNEFTGGVVFASMMIFASIAIFSSGDNATLAAIMGLASLIGIYGMGLIAYNRTHIEMDENAIHVSRRPLPALNAEQMIHTHDLVAIHCEETVASKENNYDLQRYQVWGETVNGARRVIVNDVTEEYGYFIAQRLQARLEPPVQLEADYAHLTDQDDHNADDMAWQEQQSIQIDNR